MFGRYAVLVLLSWVHLTGCVRLTAVRSWQGEPIDVPEEALVYSTDARSEDAAAGAGAVELEAEVRAALASRGDQAITDGALTATASWVLRQLNQGRPVSAPRAPRRARSSWSSWRWNNSSKAR